MSRYLVAGGAGSLGSAVVEELLRRGQTVAVADAFLDSGDGRTAREERVARFSEDVRVTVARLDLTVEDEVRSLLADFRPDAVVNAAFFPPDGPGVAPLVEAARETKVPFLVHVSDGALYGPPPAPGALAGEDEPIEPGEDRTLLARAAEEERVRVGGVPFAILRLFDVLAPGQPPSRFPSDVLEAILAGEEVVLPEDEPHDFVDAWDAVRGVLLALGTKPRGRTVNVGSGRPTRPSEVVAALYERAFRPSRRVRVVGGAARPPRIADPALARELISFNAERTLSASSATIVPARLLGPPESTTTKPARPAAPERRPVEPEAPREVSRRELFGLFRRPLGRDR